MSEFFVARRKRWAAAVGGLYIATGSSIHRKPVVDRCCIPQENGEPCGHPMFEGEDRGRFEKHVAGCAQRNQQYVIEYLERKHPRILEPWDTELDLWITRNRDAILEGRKTI